MSADLALAADPTQVERVADPGEFIVQACERAKAWLREALDHGEIDQIVECKSQAEAIRVYTMSKQLGMDAQISATEIVRRAERGIGVAIRRGQEAGEIRRQGQGRGYTQQLPKPTDFASHDELMGNQAGIYDMTDGISDGDFEEAIAGAKADQNLSRANVVRRIRAPKKEAAWIPNPEDRSTGAAVRRRELIREYAEANYSSRQISEALSIEADTIRRIARELGVEIPADKVIGRTAHHDSNRIVRETTFALDGLVMGVGLVRTEDLDPGQIADWADSLAQSIRVLNRFVRQLREAAQ